MAIYAMEKAYILKPFASLEQKYADLRFLSRQYNQRISTKVKNRVYLGNLLDETMPGIEKLLTSSGREPEKNILFLFIRKFKSFDEIKRWVKNGLLPVILSSQKKLGAEIIK